MHASAAPSIPLPGRGALLPIALLAALAVQPVLGGTPLVTGTGDRVVLSNGLLKVTFEAGQLRSIEDETAGAPLLSWPPGRPAWAVYFANDLLEPPAGGELEIHHSPEQVTIEHSSSCGPDRPVRGTMSLSLGRDGRLEMTVGVRNGSGQEIESVVFPHNARADKGPKRFLVYPYESGILIPLDERFGRIRLYDQYPFIMGYPSNRCSMQWFGVYGPAGGFMLQGTDRYGSIKRMGVRDAGEYAEVLCEHQASLEPGGEFSPAPLRVISLPGGGYRQMAGEYRRWVCELPADGAVARRETGGATPRVPLQFMSLEDKLRARPQLAQVAATHGYPEHAVREDARGDPVAYVPYGLALASCRNFEAVYKGRVTPQLWSPFTGAAGGWRHFPPREFLQQPLEVNGTVYPGLSLDEFLAALNEDNRPVFLYVNPSFWREGTPDYDAANMFDADGDGVGETFGGFEAGASAREAYVSPYLVRDYMTGQLGHLAATAARPGANGIMFDSSQVFGAVMWWGSRVRRDPLSCIDRNPKARHRERYGYLGRDAGVQDKLQTYLALHEATPGAAKVGEWICEFETLFLDVNAGSVDLKREFPDSSQRPAEDNVIPIPLFQMVYGDSELFVVRVGAASDANMAPESPEHWIPAEVTRRGSALFGAIHQSLYWGGVRWAGEAVNRLRARTWMVVRDNTARRELFGKLAGFRMLNAAGREDSGMFRVRETTWQGGEGETVALHWDNNSGVSATCSAELDGRTVDAESLWGEPEPVAGSLGRLRQGSTVTLMRDGCFCLWSFAGTIRRAHRPCVTVTDTAPAPAGLAVIWDGRFLSVANESARPRSVTVRLGDLPGELVPVSDIGPLSPDGVPLQGPSLRYNQATDWSWDAAEGLLTVDLPAASPTPGNRSLEVPATLAAFEALGEDWSGKP